MTRNPIEAEAAGQEFVTADYRGHEFLVPLDLDRWPLDSIRRCRLLNTTTKQITVNQQLLVLALRELLGAQWPAFVAATPKKRHLVPASNAFAAAVGVPADEGIKTDIAFGGVPRLLNLIDEWPGKVESDLNRFWHIDYRDRWRFTRRGQRKLTLRQIHERLSNLPVDSALAIAINNGRLHYTNTDLLLMDLFELWAKRRHPSRPMSAAEKRERDAVAAKSEQDAADHKARMDKRRAAQKKTTALSSARANAQRALQEETAHAQG
ncbi:hypothetical protein [Mycolicibacterium fluoranthenivorans]|uniref:Uncharacterized protein n=1 Tax=Mycolicibacterium fluoranthenivorans TaxID=258505 RepID=A0A7X5ZF97_9MYCO|nr:hypothetical protein [Mycolicibacterium fluoranthenivorans]MCV7358478.1 hypothetical protein [Mycolicibacterium fluoranthenivorans]NIH98054.1 hypothetical protein [Mycolicibacterium fluoranthenivorans]